MRPPNFIIAGTLPSGTGHLYGLLRQHPDVYLPAVMQPECNFFCKSGLYEKGLAYYLARWFEDVGSQRAVGERSSLLLSSALGPARVAKHLPDVRLIFLLRNPVDRAYANYRFTALAGYEDATFEEALEAEPLRTQQASRDAFWSEIQPHAYVGRGFYAQQLERWRRHFPAEQVLVMRSDELLRDQAGALRKVYRFLDVDDAFEAEDFSDFSSPAVHDVKLQSRLRREAPHEFDAAVQCVREGQPPRTDLERAVCANVQAGYPPLEPALRRRLTALYAASNRQLQSLVSFPVDDWL
jgi:hypothetical protein